MTPFAEIEAAALKREGGRAALDARLPVPKSAGELARMPDDRWLSVIALRIFRAGLKHELVDAKWPAFEEVFHGFDPHRVGMMSDEDLERLLGDRRLIRHGGKMRAVRDNAAPLIAISREAGGFGRWIADWPGERITELWAALQKRFKGLGGNSAGYVLRMTGKDTFMLSDAVVRALGHWGAFPGKPSSKADLKRVQEIFDAWAAESGRPLCQISMTLARSVD